MGAAKENIHIRLNAEQKKMVTELAEAYGKSLTEFVIMMAEYVNETRPTFEVKPKKRQRSNNLTDK